MKALPVVTGLLALATASASDASTAKVRLHGTVGSRSGIQTGIDIYYVTNGNYDAHKLYDTKISPESGAVFHGDGYWDSHGFSCEFLRPIAESIIVCANAASPIFIDRIETMGVDEYGRWKALNWWGASQNRGVWIPNQRGHECYRFNSSAYRQSYAIRPERRNDTPYCTVDVGDDFGGAAAARKMLRLPETSK